MKPFNYPKKSAYQLAQKMREFLTKTEETAHSEINVNADSDRSEVVRQINWSAFNEVIRGLEFPYLHRINK